MVVLQGLELVVYFFFFLGVNILSSLLKIYACVSDFE